LNINAFVLKLKRVLANIMRL